MLKTILFTLICTLTFSAFAQAQHESFKQDKELEKAFIQKNFNQFISEPVTFIFDTLERQVTSAQLTDLMNTYVPKIKNTVIKKASETNNGYVQSFGMYKGDDALYYVRFTLNPLSGKLEEVVVEKN